MDTDIGKIKDMGGYFEILLHCKKMTRVHISYECPFCYTLKSKRDISRDEQVRNNYKSAKPTIHRHGTAGEYQNGIRLSRFSHCRFDKTFVKLLVDDDTEKIIP